ncbi:MAG: hypothetical protein ACYDA1_10945, partial [Vulcanimicrobiaceae bacterium]
VEAIARGDSSWFSYNPSAFPDAQMENRRSESNAHTVKAFADAGIDINTRLERGQTLDAIMQAESADLEFFSSERFQVFRILLNMYYSLLPVLSISPAERFGMCYLVAKSHVREN